MEPATIHATTILLGDAGAAFGGGGDAGVLLLGKPGSGKSSLALRLLTLGARLIADDRTHVFLRENALWARAPAAIAGLLEVRGVGILQVPHADCARIWLAVVLEPGVENARIPVPRYFEAPAGFADAAAVPLITLDGANPAAAERIAAAAAAFRLGLFREQAHSG